MLKTLLRPLKTSLLYGINALPVSSLVIGSPRRTVLARDIKLNKEDGEEYIKVHEAKTINEAPPKSLDKEVFFKFRDYYRRTQPEQFILNLTNARAWGRNGTVITSDDALISDVSREFGAAKFDVSKNSIFRQVSLKKPVELKGSLAVIASPGTSTYAHWFADIVPRIILLKKAGILDTVDKILFNYARLDFQVETLKQLNVDESKIINCIDDPHFHIRASTLYVPSHPNKHGTANPWLCKEVKKMFGENGDVGKKLRIYISRSKAVGRKLVNEDELLQLLQNEYGFINMRTEEYSMKEKAEIFSSAECVIGPHGSGLMNIFFAEPGCKVINIIPPGDFDTLVWSLANSNSLDYYYFFGKGEMPTEEKDVLQRNADIDIDMEKFKGLLNYAKLEKIK